VGTSIFNLVTRTENKHTALIICMIGYTDVPSASSPCSRDSCCVESASTITGTERCDAALGRSKTLFNSHTLDEIKLRVNYAFSKPYAFGDVQGLAICDILVVVDDNDASSSQNCSASRRQDLQCGLLVCSGKLEVSHSDLYS
jgi:hypothetical protein